MKNTFITGLFVCITVPQFALGVYLTILAASTPGMVSTSVGLCTRVAITGADGHCPLKFQRNSSLLSALRHTNYVSSPDIGRWRLPTQPSHSYMVRFFRNTHLP